MPTSKRQGAAFVPYLEGIWQREEAFVDELTKTYRDWILDQRIEGCTLELQGDGKVNLKSDLANGEINFYDINGTTVVELRLERADDGEPCFFLHFELEELDRAKSLFGEMVEAFEGLGEKQARHILLCCTCGITTTFFANKLNEVAKSMEIEYDFCAKSIEEAKETGGEYTAVLLAPQVGHKRKELVEALPDTLVLELPGSMFGSYDAVAGVRFVVDAVTGARLAAKSDLRMARDFDHSKRVLAISYVIRSDESTLCYRVLDKGVDALQGMLVRSHFDIYVLYDLAATLKVAGYPLEGFDAVGVAMPGMIDKGVVVQMDEGASDFDLAAKLSQKWHVPVRVDNNAVAAAAGCYISQNDWDDVAFHAQAIGVAECDEGLVIGGLVRAGKAGFAGNLGYLASNFSLSMDLEEAAWRYDGTRELVARYLEATICTVAPEAIFVWCDLVTDMEELREELLKNLPASAIPELIPVADYDGLTLLGELSLCLQGIDE